MRTVIGVCFLATAMAVAGSAHAEIEQLSKQSGEQMVQQRLQEGLRFIQEKPWPDPKKNVDQAASMALLLLFRNENVDEANRLVLAYCGQDPLTVYAGKRVPKTRCESLYRIYLVGRTRRLLNDEARKAIENHAWELLTRYNRDIVRADADKRFWGFTSSENHFLNDRRRYTLALQILYMAKSYGPRFKLGGETIESHCRAWLTFWKRYFRDRASEGIDVEVAHPSSYGLCTVGVYYDLYDLIGDAELRALAGSYLTLFWAEVATEFEPRTGQRAGWASTRNPFYDGQRTYWARDLLYCYGWHDNAFSSRFVGQVPFLTSSYRPPEIVSAIARDRNRGCYLTTCRRPGLVKAGTDFPIIFDENGDAHIRRDVYYTPNYALSTLTYDPHRDYRTSVRLAQAMGATFATDQHYRITVMGTGYYASRAISGITGRDVSILARDPKATHGRGRFKSDGTRVFISNGDLWDNRVEDPSGWFFTRSGGSYVAVRAAGPGYRITTRTYIWPNRKLKEVEEKNGHYLELQDMWAPIVIQMGRAADHETFEAFCAGVKANGYVYADGKLTYASEANDRYEYWAKGAHPPQVNGVKVNLNPEKTYDTPYLSMIHGEAQAVIRYPGYEDLRLNFGAEETGAGQQSPGDSPKAAPEESRLCIKGDRITMNRRLYPIVISVICFVFIRGLSAAEEKPTLKTWSKEKAWQWYNARSWINGCNYLPSYAGNSTEFWQADTFDAEIIEKELALAKGVGYNSIRVLMQYLVWENNPEGYRRRFLAFLEIADKHGISVMPQFFDDCAFGLQPDTWKRKNPYLGKQDDPIPGGFFPNWAPSPGHSRVTDESAWPRLKKYMLDFMATHKDDKRILAWDLYNEPTNGGMGNKSLPLLEAVFQWAREIKVSQPITSGVWNGDNSVNSIILENSDIITFHQYPAPNPNRYKETGRPVICTEWMIRIRGSNIHKDIFANTLPILKEKKIGSYSWGLVNGRSQAQFQWGSKPGTPEPEIWFTDIFRDIQGTPYAQDEIDAIRNISGIAGKTSAQQSSAGDGKPAPEK